MFDVRRLRDRFYGAVSASWCRRRVFPVACDSAAKMLIGNDGDDESPSDEFPLVMGKMLACGAADVAETRPPISDWRMPAHRLQSGATGEEPLQPCRCRAVPRSRTGATERAEMGRGFHE